MMQVILNLEIPECGLRHGLETVRDRGGMYLSLQVLLWGDQLASVLSKPFTVGVFGQDKSEIAFLASLPRREELNIVSSIVSKAGKSTPVWNARTLNLKPSDRVDVWNCSAYVIKSKDADLDNCSCFSLPERISPWDIANDLDSPLSQALTSELLSHNKAAGSQSLAPPNMPVKIPRIVHYVWFGDKEFSFGMYLSFLSSVYIVRPASIVVHTDHRLYGRYWLLVKSHPLVHVAVREQPRYVFQHQLLYRQHLSDIVRADVLDKYGGIYVDWDAYWLRSPDPLLNSGYDVILSRDHMPRPGFPDTINMGVAMAKPRSEFIRRWRAAFVNYRSRDFYYNAIELPYKVYEETMGTVKIDDRLQVSVGRQTCKQAGMQVGRLPPGKYIKFTPHLKK